MNGNPAIHWSASGNRRTRSAVLGVAMAVTLTVGAVLAASAASRNDPAFDGPRINQTLSGGVARDLTPQELRYVNQARGVLVR
jgi:hypothetical protein